MNLRRGKLPFSLYSFRAGFTLSFGFVMIWSLKRSTTKAMASTPPRRSYRVRSVIVTPPSPSWAEYVLPIVLYCLYARCALLVRAPESPSSTMQLFGYGCITVGPDPSLLPLIHPSDPWPLPGHPEAMKKSYRRDYFHTSAWKGNSAKFAYRILHSPARWLPYGRPESSRFLKVDHYMLHLRIMMRSGAYVSSGQDTDYAGAGGGQEFRPRVCY